MKKRIGVLTGGGDVPGLNPAMKEVVLNALDAGYEVLGIRRGWGGLLWYNLDEPSTHDYYIRNLGRNDVRRIDRTGGTFLHTDFFVGMLHAGGVFKVKPDNSIEFQRARIGK